MVCFEKSNAKTDSVRSALSTGCGSSLRSNVLIYLRLAVAAKIETKKPQSKPKLASSISLTGDQIRKAREGKGWSQRKLAGWMGVTQTLVGYWEKGKRTPSADMEAKLRQLLEITN